MTFYKTTKKLFLGTYQYKVVLVCPSASSFRNNDLDQVLDVIKKTDLAKASTAFDNPYNRSNKIRTQDDLDYVFKLHSTLSKSADYELRVENPWISIYTNDKKFVNSLKNINVNRVKYISEPASNVTLDSGTIIMPKMNYEFRVTLGKTIQEHSAFVNWAEQSTKVKLTKSCKRDLLKNRTWGGTHFYISGENNLLLAKMHLGGSIAKVERIIKA